MTSNTCNSCNSKGDPECSREIKVRKVNPITTRNLDANDICQNPGYTTMLLINNKNQTVFNGEPSGAYLPYNGDVYSAMSPGDGCSDKRFLQYLLGEANKYKYNQRNDILFREPISKKSMPTENDKKKSTFLKEIPSIEELKKKISDNRMKNKRSTELVDSVKRKYDNICNENRNLLVHGESRKKKKKLKNIEDFTLKTPNLKEIPSKTKKTQSKTMIMETESTDFTIHNIEKPQLDEEKKKQVSTSDLREIPNKANKSQGERMLRDINLATPNLEESSKAKDIQVSIEVPDEPRYGENNQNSAPHISENELPNADEEAMKEKGTEEMNLSKRNATEETSVDDEYKLFTPNYVINLQDGSIITISSSDVSSSDDPFEKDLVSTSQKFQKTKKRKKRKRKSERIQGERSCNVLNSTPVKSNDISTKNDNTGILENGPPAFVERGLTSGFYNNTNDKSPVDVLDKSPISIRSTSSSTSTYDYEEMNLETFGKVMMERMGRRKMKTLENILNGQRNVPSLQFVRNMYEEKSKEAITILTDSSSSDEFREIEELRMKAPRTKTNKRKRSVKELNYSADCSNMEISLSENNDIRKERD